MNRDERFQRYMKLACPMVDDGEAWRETDFTDHMCQFLEEEGVLKEYVLVNFRNPSTGLKVDGYEYDEETGELVLVISDFRQQAEWLNATEIATSLRRVSRFFQKSLDSSFHEGLHDHIPGRDLARLVYLKSGAIDKVRFIVISNAFLSKRTENIDDVALEHYKSVVDVWDLDRIGKVEESGKAREDIVIDIAAEDGNGLPFIKAHASTNCYESYLAVVPGTLVADLYEKYGERLLEQNVRTFLQFRGKVNKGIRNTIRNEPDMFFAYNNGITATAERVEVTNSDSGPRMTRIHNLQIVNGGQTTASIFMTRRKDKASLDRVFVQLKLSVIPPDRTEQIVPAISRCANTQNKVSEADFFSNHPFHLRIEELSRRLLAPKREGEIWQTRWYYERVRGAYANAQSTLTDAQRKVFQKENPRKQMFTKTDLAKFQVSWERKPYQVSMGAQKNFLKFAEVTAKQWDSDKDYFNELYFRQLIAKALMFRTLDGLIMKQAWYGGYKANIVTYSLAKLSDTLYDEEKHLDMEGIWANQTVPAIVVEELLKIAAVVNKSIQDPPRDFNNISEWCKRESCWTRVRAIDHELSSDLTPYLVDASRHKSRERQARQMQNIDNGIDAQTHVLERGCVYWNEILAWNQEEEILTAKDIGILGSAAQLPAKIPSEKQCLALVEIESRAQEEGFMAASTLA